MLKHLRFVATKIIALRILLLMGLMVWGSVGRGQTNYVSWDFTTSLASGQYAGNQTNMDGARTSALTSPTFTGITNAVVTSVSALTFHRTTSWPFNTASVTGSTTSYVEFTITLGSGQTFANIALSLNLTLGTSNTGTGPNRTQVIYGWGASPSFSTAGSAMTLTTGQVAQTAVSIPAPGNTTTTKLTIRIAAYQTTNTTQTGNFRISSIALTGASAPLSTTAPTAPTITGITPGNAQLSIAFTAPSSDGGSAITNYKYSTDGGATFKLAGTTTSPFTITTVSGSVAPLVNGTSYNVQIRAVNAIGDGTATSSTAATPRTVPGAPTITGITPGNTQLTVAFTPPSSNGGSAISDYKYSTDGGATFKSAGTTSSPFTISTVSGSASTLVNGTSYDVQIQAVNVAGDGTASATTSATPTSGATAPGAPTITTITPGNAQLSVAFTSPASDGGSTIIDYKYSTDGGATFKSAGTTSSPYTITTVSGSTSALVNGTTYNVQIRAVNAIGDGVPTSPTLGTPRTTPDAPTINGITSGNTQLTVSFTAPGFNGGSAITDYKYSTDGGTTFKSAGTTTSPFIITTVSGSTSSLVNGTSYNVQIRAVNAAGDGTETGSTAATPRTTPGAPAITGITPGNAQLSVAFTAPVSDGGSVITDYKYSTDGGTSFKSAGTTTSPFTITTVSGSVAALVNGTSYNVQIRAINVAGDGTATGSTAATPRTTPGAPTITGITPGNTQLIVAFTAPASTGGATITDYKYSTDGGTSFKSAGTTTSPYTINTVSGSTAALVNGTSYSVQIRAVNAAGDGTASGTVSGTPSIPPIYWNFTTATPTSGVPTNLTVSAITQGNNNGTTTLLTNGSASSTSDYSTASAGNNAGAAARAGALNTDAGGSAYFEFTFTPDPSYQVSVTAISFGVRSTSSGPQAYSLRSSKDNYATDIATGTNSNGGLWQFRSNSSLTIISNTGIGITFRIYGYNGTGTPSINTANWRIDDLSISLSVTQNTTPFISTSVTSLSAFATTNVGSSSTGSSFNINGDNLTGGSGNILVAAPTHFEVSTDNSIFSPSVNVPYTGTSLSTTTIWARLTPTSDGAKSGNISISGGGVTTPVTVGVSGTAALNIPVAIAADNISSGGFTAKWNAVPGAVDYKLDVSLINTFTAPTVSSAVTEGFNNSRPLFPTGTGGSYFNSTSGTGDRPASSPFTTEGTHSLGVTNDNITITSSNIDLTGYGNRSLTFRLAAFSIASTGNGPDAGDIVTVEISPDGGLTYYATLRVLGNSNSYWPFSAGGTASTSYDGNATPVDFSTSAGGDRTSDGFGTITITSLPEVTNLRVRITIVNDSGNERWVIDDLKVQGNAPSFIAGYNSKTVTGTSDPVSGLAPATEYHYRVRASGNSFTSTYSNVISVTTLNNPSTADYRSKTSGNFNSISTWEYNSTGSSWIDATQVPTSTNNITVRNNHTITQDVNYTVGSGKTLTLDATSSWVVNPNITLTVTGTSNFNSRPVLFRSDINGTAIFGNSSGTINGADNVTVERYVPGKRAWRMATTPLKNNTSNKVFDQWQNAGTSSPTYGVEIWGPLQSGIPSSNTTGLANGTSHSMLKLVNSAWSNVTNTKSEALFNTGVIGNANPNNAFLLFITSPFKNGAGLIANFSGAEPTTLRATGTLITGAASYLQSSTAGQFHLVPNPYAAPVNPASITTTNAGNYFWVWDPALGGASSFGGYIAYSRIPTIGFSTPPTTGNYIQSGQAFFAQAAAAANITVNFTESMKGTAANNGTNFRIASPINGGGNASRINNGSYELLRVTLQRNNSGVYDIADGAVGVFYNTGVNAVDANDGPKLPNTNDNLMFRRDNNNLTFEHRQLVDQKDTLYMRLSNTVTAPYRFVIEGSNFDVAAGLRAVLQDNYLNNETTLNLYGSTTIDFAIDNTVAASSGDRFRIVFRPDAATGVTDPDLTRGIKVYPNPAIKGSAVQLEFRNRNAGKYAIVLYNINGTQVFNKVVNHGGGSNVYPVTVPQQMPSGAYLIQVTDAAGKRATYKISIQ